MMHGWVAASRAGWAIFFIACFCAALLPIQPDPDLWGHIRFGLDTIAAKGVVRSDPYSYLTRGHAWINHEWLAEVFFAAGWRVAGASGLIIGKFSLIAAIGVLIYRHLVRAGWGGVGAGLALLFLVWPLGPGLLVARPHLFTCLGFLVILLVLEEDREGGWFWALPLVVALWANLHGGVVAGLAWMMLWLVMHWGLACARLLRDWVAPPRRLAAGTAVVVLCGLATFANPYGGELPAFLLREAWLPRPEITEWNPVDVRTAAGSSYLALVLIARVAMGKGGIGLIKPVMIAVGGLLPLLAARHLPLFALVVAVSAARPLAVHWSRGIAALERFAGRSPIPGPGLAAAGVALLLVQALRTGGEIPCARPGTFDVPARAVELMKRAEVEGGLAVHFDWGEYVIWHLGPGVRVAVDGRRETAYPRAVYDLSVRFLRGREGWDDLIKDPRTALALVPRDWPCWPLLGLSEGWVLVHSDQICALFARRGSVPASLLGGMAAPEVPPGGAGLRFPGP